MRVIVGCETSQRVCLAFRALGHEAYSCDLLPCRGAKPEFHYQMGIFDCVTKFGPFDLGIFHPECTYLTVAAARWLKDQPERKSGKLVGQKRRDAQLIAVQFVKDLWALPIEKKVVENPKGSLSTLWMKPTQIIHPWQFGHGEQKETCLWLDNLPLLKPTDIVEGREQRIWKLPPTADRWQLRSDTFQGIADAFAQQFGIQTS